MRLDQTLVQRGLCDSRTEAQELIERKLVSVNGVVTTKQAKEIQDTDTLVVSGKRDFVSRGGDKLRGIFQDMYGEDEEIRKALSGTYVLDIGSSTGGFTDCVLSYGAAHVDAVDVGSEQLHSTLRGDQRVSLFEATDIRSFMSETRYDFVVADMSFISLETVFDTIISFGKPGAHYFLLIKPQFEVGKGNTKKGVVKDMDIVLEVLKKYEVLAKIKGMESVQIFPCHLQGGDGNQEYFLVASQST